MAKLLESVRRWAGAWLPVGYECYECCVIKTHSCLFFWLCFPENMDVGLQSSANQHSLSHCFICIAIQSFSPVSLLLIMNNSVKWLRVENWDACYHISLCKRFEDLLKEVNRLKQCEWQFKYSNKVLEWEVCVKCLANRLVQYVWNKLPGRW